MRHYTWRRVQHRRTEHGGARPSGRHALAADAEGAGSPSPRGLGGRSAQQQKATSRHQPGIRSISDPAVSTSAACNGRTSSQSMLAVHALSCCTMCLYLTRLARSEMNRTSKVATTSVAADDFKNVTALRLLPGTTYLTPGASPQLTGPTYSENIGSSPRSQTCLASARLTDRSRVTISRTLLSGAYQINC
jgi:hypothetical protein